MYMTYRCNGAEVYEHYHGAAFSVTILCRQLKEIYVCRTLLATVEVVIVL